MMEIIDRDTGVVLVKGPTLMVPGKGDTVVLRDIRYIVDRRVYEFLPLQASKEASMIVRIYVIQIRG
jgi:hypothetical protein